MEPTFQKELKTTFYVRFPPRDCKNLTNIKLPNGCNSCDFLPRLMNLVHTILYRAAQQVFSGKRRIGQLPKLHRARPPQNDSRPWPFLSSTAHTPIRGGGGVLVLIPRFLISPPSHVKGRDNKLPDRRAPPRIVQV